MTVQVYDPAKEVCEQFPHIKPKDAQNLKDVLDKLTRPELTIRLSGSALVTSDYKDIDIGIWPDNYPNLLELAIASLGAKDVKHLYLRASWLRDRAQFSYNGTKFDVMHCCHEWYLGYRRS